MNWKPSQRVGPREFPSHLNDLGLRLRELAAEVRGAVAELTGEALGRAVRDALMRFWRQLPAAAAAPRPQAPRASAYDWSDDPTVEPWRREESGWADEEYRPPMPATVERPDADNAPSTAHLFALALHAGGWFLQRYGSWLGALGVGCTVGGLALLGGRAAVAGFSLLQAVSELYALNNVLASSGDALTSD
jgi:hypothetical protein